jgi:hypothetical protein
LGRHDDDDDDNVTTPLPMFLVHTKARSTSNEGASEGVAPPVTLVVTPPPKANMEAGTDLPSLDPTSLSLLRFLPFFLPLQPPFLVPDPSFIVYDPVSFLL